MFQCVDRVFVAHRFVVGGAGEPGGVMRAPGRRILRVHDRFGGVPRLADRERLGARRRVGDALGVRGHVLGHEIDQKDDHRQYPKADRIAQPGFPGFGPGRGGGRGQLAYLRRVTQLSLLNGSGAHNVSGRRENMAV